jgi:hypothetical protein
MEPLTTNRGFGEVTSYSAVHEAVEEQRKPPPILLKLTLLAFARAGLAAAAGHFRVLIDVPLP